MLDNYCVARLILNYFFNIINLKNGLSAKQLLGKLNIDNYYIALHNLLDIE